MRERNDLIWCEKCVAIHLFYFIFFSLSRSISQSSQFALLIVMVTWFDFVGICENVEQEPVQTLLTVGKLNVFLPSQWNKFFIAFCVPFQRDRVEMPKQKKYINKWMLDRAVSKYILEETRNEKLCNAGNCISKRCAWMKNFSLPPVVTIPNDINIHRSQWIKWEFLFRKQLHNSAVKLAKNFKRKREWA